MTKPTYEEMLEGSCKWSKNHKDINYLLSFHGYVNPKDDKLFGEGHEGTWCYYLLIPQQMFPHRWEDFKVGAYMDHIEGFESVDFHGGITYTYNEPYYDRKTEKTWDCSKVGCDYNHLWDGESGYQGTYWSVNEDAKRSVEKFIETNPDGYYRCRWSGLWDRPENFYECVGGWMVHEESEVPEDYENWKPKND